MIDLSYLLHNHVTTNLNITGLRPEGECKACDFLRHDGKARS